MNKRIILISLLLLSTQLFAQEEVKLKSGRTIIININGTWKYKQSSSDYGTFTDSRDGKVYKTVKIGTQTWIAENLSYKASSGCWAYNDDVTNVAKYGYLYNWETAKNVCPVGWHLPTDAEWTTLLNYLGGYRVAGGKMKETGTIHWESPNTGANDSIGFSGLPGGLRNVDGKTTTMGIAGYWWSSTECSQTSAYHYRLYFGDEMNSQFETGKNRGFSIRCIKD